MGNSKNADWIKIAFPVCTDLAPYNRNINVGIFCLLTHTLTFRKDIREVTKVSRGAFRHTHQFHRTGPSQKTSTSLANATHHWVVVLVQQVLDFRCDRLGLVDIPSLPPAKLAFSRTPRQIPEQVEGVLGVAVVRHAGCYYHLANDDEATETKARLILTDKKDFWRTKWQRSRKQRGREGGIKHLDYARVFGNKLGKLCNKLIVLFNRWKLIVRNTW